MFDLGTQELIVIFIVAFLVFGPKKMPELGRTLGKGLMELKKAMRGISESLEDAGSDVKEEVNDVTSGFKDSVYKSIESNLDEINRSIKEKKTKKTDETGDTPSLFGDDQEKEAQPPAEAEMTAEEEKKEPGADG